MIWRPFSISAAAIVLLSSAPALAEAPRDAARKVVESGPYQRDFPGDTPRSSGGTGGTGGGSIGGGSSSSGGGVGTSPQPTPRGGKTIGPRKLGGSPGGPRSRSGTRGLGMPGAGAFGSAIAYLVIAVIVILLIALAAWILLSARSPDFASEAQPAPLRPDDERKKLVIPRGDLRSEAERLAREGRYDEAIHLLLLAAIVHLSRGAAPPDSRTSRELLKHFRLDGTSRDAFRALVFAVERSLFGGQPLGAEDWSEAASRHDTLVAT